MTVPAVGPVGFTPFVPPTLTPEPAAAAGSVTGATATTQTPAAGGVDFAHLLANGLERLQGLHDRTDQLAVQAATGDLTSLHDYTIAATEATVATQLTTAVRNKALEAFQDIMRMSI